MRLGSLIRAAARPNRLSLVALFSGALTVFGFAPFEFSPLALFGLAGLFWLWTRAESKAQAFHYGLVFGLGQFGLGVSWLFSSVYFHSEIGLIGAVALVAGFVIVLAVFPALVGVLVKSFYNTNHPGAALLWLMPAAWVLIEWLRAQLFGGLPFLTIGTSHLNTWLDGYAPLFGVYGVSFVVAMSAGLVVWFLAYKQSLPAAIVMVFVWPIGGVLQDTEWTQPSGEPIKVALLQGNIPQELKWQPDQFIPSMQRYIGMTRQNLDAELIVWPETSIPAYFDQAARGPLKTFVSDAKLQSRDILVGAITRDPESGRYFNAMLNLRDEQEYRKRHLVMFGEYYPLSSLIEPLAQALNFPFSQFSAGSNANGVLTLAGQPAGVSICFEMMFGADLARDLPQAKYFVTTSNDAWFAHTFEPAQLRQEVQMRARELGREIARATNTGHTVIVDVKGQIKAEIPAYQPGVLRGEIQPYEGMTPYARWTNWPIIIFSLTIFGLVFAKRYAFTGKFSNPFNRKK